MRSLVSITGFAVLSLAFLSGCVSSQIKERKAQRDKIAQTSKLYCDFINGESFPDIEVALNLEMAKKCDSNKPSSMTNYRSPSEATGIVFCCAMKDKDEAKKPEAKSNDKNQDKSADKKSDSSGNSLDLDADGGGSTSSPSGSTPDSAKPGDSAGQKPVDPKKDPTKK